ncbi:MAG: hypothetical protein K0U40_08005 [Betaproteobacteria bacterium]|nr:hypothetical protein [Betaproteobacteria bacterium]
MDPPQTQPTWALSSFHHSGSPQRSRQVQSLDLLTRTLALNILEFFMASRQAHNKARRKLLINLVKDDSVPWMITNDAPEVQNFFGEDSPTVGDFLHG